MSRVAGSVRLRTRQAVRSSTYKGWNRFFPDPGIGMKGRGTGESGGGRVGASICPTKSPPEPMTSDGRKMVYGKPESRTNCSASAFVRAYSDGALGEAPCALR